MKIYAFPIICVALWISSCQNELQKNGSQADLPIQKENPTLDIPQHSDQADEIQINLEPIEDFSGQKDNVPEAGYPDAADAPAFPSEYASAEPTIGRGDSDFEGGASITHRSTSLEKKSTVGRLTAGEINDFQKWKMWEDLSETELKRYQDQWQIKMHDRYCMVVRNQQGFPVIDATCTLVNEAGQTLWTAHTDNTGKAELWRSFAHSDASQSAVKLKVASGKHIEWIEKPKPFSRGVNHLKLRQPCDVKKQVDIVFTVDATGSMGDEINYLKDELTDVLQQIQDKHDVSLHTGSVFYRDHGDEYVTRVSGLTANMETTMQFIRQQSANGGGDGPEAVDDALIASIDQMNWRKSARARIMFLILDAPPHSSNAHQTRLKKAMASAAEKGVRIVPLVASGGGYEFDKSMEYLMRSLALATNGTYVFLTNHSGIGNHHTAPSTDKYKVETLNSILLRIVGQYIEAPGCHESDWQEVTEATEETQLIVPTSPTTTETPIEIRLSCYPNPADNSLWITSSVDMEELFIADNSGKLLQKLKLNAGTTEINTSLYPSGIYFIRVLVDREWRSMKFVVLHI
jgi:hypothetical protein